MDYNVSMYKHVIFDLDGTLLDTLTDIRRAINDALWASNIPMLHSKAKVKTFMGFGAEYLVHTALGEFDNEENFKKVYGEYMPRYEEYQLKHTKPFNGLPQTLRFLHDKHIKLYILTNKPNDYALKIVSICYENDLFEVVKGKEEGGAGKTDPAFILSFLKSNGIDPKEALYVGDSKADLILAKNAKMDLCLCEWGYGQYKKELLEEAKYVIKKPKELVQVIL